MWVTVNICTVSTFILPLRSWKTFFSCSVISQIKMSNWRAFCRPPSGVDEWGGAKHWAGEPSYLTTSNPLTPHNQGELIAVECGWGWARVKGSRNVGDSEAPGRKLGGWQWHQLEKEWHLIQPSGFVRVKMGEWVLIIGLHSPYTSILLSHWRRIHMFMGWWGFVDS